MTESSAHERPLVTVVVRTRHPEDYLLVNEADGSRWRIVDGRWRLVEGHPSDR
jgi:hypothetical protein